MANTLSHAVEETKKLARRNKHRLYGQSAASALRSMGYANPSISVRVARIVNDIGADESKSLLHAVTAQLGKEGAATARVRWELRDEQLTISFI